MPVTTRSHCKINEDNTMIKVTKAEDLCEGFKKVAHIGIFKKPDEECTPCNPQKESWLSLSYGENKGISA